MTALDEKLIQEIIGRILRITNPDKVILFGSSVTENMTPDSDIDLLVVAKSARNTREASVQINDALRGLGFPFDVIVMASERFDELKNIVGTIAYPANKYGKVIYDAG